MNCDDLEGTHAGSEMYAPQHVWHRIASAKLVETWDDVKSARSTPALELSIKLHDDAMHQYILASTKAYALVPRTSVS
jgi:hypothetical protein